MTTPIRMLAIDQMDRRLPRLQRAAEELRRQAPHGSWIGALRGALGLSERAFAKRLGITQRSLQQLERNEEKGSVTLESLRRAAQALDADFVYAVVPRKPLRATLSSRARALAAERLDPIAHSMAMEGQALSSRQLKRQIEELASELEKKPRELWR
jgi:predicted DNA-binding mobile mystery protein A